MERHLPVLLAVVLVPGCVRVSYHVPPKPGRPAATVKFRIHVAAARPQVGLPFGANLGSFWPSALIRIDGRVLRFRATGLRAGRVLATWTKVRPGWRALDFTGWWNVRFTVQVQKTVYVTKTETCWKYKCQSSYGVGGYQRRCGTVSELCTKRVPQRKWVWVHRTIQAGACRTRARFWMRNGATYLLTLA